MSAPRVPGHCRWCARPILNDDDTINLRRLWHPICSKEYLLMTKPRELRKAVRKRDKKRCAVCGVTCNSSDKPWNADHVVPLFTSEGRHAWFMLANVQTLCAEHHSSKTKIDMANYRKMKRGEPIIVLVGQVSNLVLVGTHFHVVYTDLAETHKEALIADLAKFHPFLKDA